MGRYGSWATRPWTGKRFIQGGGARACNGYDMPYRQRLESAEDVGFVAGRLFQVAPPSSPPKLAVIRRQGPRALRCVSVPTAAVGLRHAGLTKCPQSHLPCSRGGGMRALKHPCGMGVASILPEIFLGCRPRDQEGMAVREAMPGQPGGRPQKKLATSDHWSKSQGVRSPGRKRGR